jgi:hypothetical protein
MLLGIGTLHHNRQNKFFDDTFIVTIGCRYLNRQRCATFIHQNVHLAAAFASVCRIATCLFTTQGGRAILAVYRLPFPTDLASFMVELHHFDQDGLKDTDLLPELHTRMGSTCRYTKPFSFQRFPLAACPQHIPDRIQHHTVFERWTSTLAGIGKMMLDPLPQWFGDSKVIDTFRFCGMLFAHGAPLDCGFVGANHFPKGASLFTNRP